MPGFPLDHVVILASDHEASLRFYEAVLGPLGFVRERGHLFGRDGLFFDVRPATAMRPARARGEPGVDHFGFVAVSRQEVDELAAPRRGRRADHRIRRRRLCGVPA